MPLSFETQMLRVGELFSDSACYVMPEFQRPYCWDEDTAGQLYDDISSAMVRGRPERPGRKNREEYFLGPLIVTRSKSSDGLEVIDGQQRLVTLTILLAILRDLLPLEDSLRDELQRLIVRPEHRLRRLAECSRVQIREPDQARFARWIQTPGGTRDLPEDDEESEPWTRILEASAQIAGELDNPHPDYIAQLASFILSNCYVIQVTARNLDDGYVLFRSLNSRGQPLNELDLARAELLGAGDTGVRIDVVQLARDWNAAEANLGREEFAEYLQSVLSLVVSQPQGRGLRDLIKEALGDPLKARNFRILLAAVLKHSAKLDEGTLEFGDDSEKIHRIVVCLRHSPLPEWRSAALPWLALNPSPYNTLQFLTALDALCLGLCILGKNKTQKLRRLKMVAAQVIEKRDRIIFEASSLRFTRAEQSQIRAILTKPIGAKKRFLKPLLLRLNAYMLDATIPVYFPNVSVEHVLPQKPKADGPWISKYPNATKRKTYTELLGNYALLTHSMNSRARNLDFQEKRLAMFSGTNSQAFPITNDLTGYGSWEEYELLQRHQKLVGLACEMLGLGPAVAIQEAAE
jgi:hypothetical protein